MNQLKKYNITLDERIKTLDENRNSLSHYKGLWELTLQNAKKELAPKAIIENISTVIKTTKTLEKTSKKHYDIILIDANLINKKILELNNMLKKTVDAQNSVSSNIFAKDSLSLTTLFSEKSSHPLKYLQSAYSHMKSEFKSLIKYYKENTSKLLVSAIISTFIAIFIFIFNYLYRKKKLFVHQESYTKKEYFFIVLPFSTLILLITLLNTFVFHDIPASVKQFQLLIIIIPIFRILKKFIPNNFNKYYYSYIVFYVLSIIERDASGFELDARVFSLALTITFIVYLIVLIRKRVLDAVVSPSVLKISYQIVQLSILLLTISFFADIYGATQLSNKITNGLFAITYSFFIFYILYIILTGYIIILLRRRIASATFEIEQFTNSIEKGTTFLIKFIMILWWLKIVTQKIGIYNYIIEVKNYVMSLVWHIGKATISLESLFNFIVIIAGTWFIIKLLNVILEVEVFSRFKFPRGVPTVITTVLNYFLTITGTLIALVSLGITIEQFALVFGALGVGIGFGIRNIIANFISGIIMVFERPIQIGDTIEINNTMGKVQAIKTRSSIIKTFDGSEVIIPNADFISKEITNWTLSDERRRKTLIFKIDMGSDIEQILEIMRNYPNVLKDPEPMATFLGFGEYYSEFKAYFWLNENLIMAQSDIAVEIYKTLQKKGIKMPMPKQRLIKEADE